MTHVALLDALAQLLADASQSPFGLPPDECREWARRIDDALVRNAPPAPLPAGVVDLRGVRL